MQDNRTDSPVRMQDMTIVDGSALRKKNARVFKNMEGYTMEEREHFLEKAGASQEVRDVLISKRKKSTKVS